MYVCVKGDWLLQVSPLSPFVDMGESVQVSLCLCYLCDDVDGDVVVWLDCAVAFVSLRGVGSQQWRLHSSHVLFSSSLYVCVCRHMSQCMCDGNGRGVDA